MYVQVFTVDGRIIQSQDAKEVSKKEVEEIKSLFRKFRQLEYISLDLPGGTETLLNPQNVVEIRFCE